MINREVKKCADKVTNGYLKQKKNFFLKRSDFHFTKRIVAPYTIVCIKFSHFLRRNFIHLLEHSET